MGSRILVHYIKPGDIFCACSTNQWKSGSSYIDKVNCEECKDTAAYQMGLLLSDSDVARLSCNSYKKRRQ